MTSDAYLPAFEHSNSLSTNVARLEPTEKIFLHYSSLEAFYSIMDTGRLRFTSAKSTNDPSEFLFGRAVVERALREIVSDLSPAERSVAAACQAKIANRDFRAFVFCMSEAAADEADVGELSQWRLYGADGRGVALVFDTTTTSRRKKLDAMGSIPRRMIYGEPDGLDFVKSEIHSYFRGLKDLPEKTLEYLAESDLSSPDYLGNRLFWLPSVIKHKAYKHEREVRLIRGDVGEHAGNPLVFYERNSIRRPAIELPISKLSGSSPNEHQVSPISRVIIGPSGDQSAIEDSIRFFLEARNWRVDVIRSDIPYRAV